jgi:hypothetical protein
MFDVRCRDKERTLQQGFLLDWMAHCSLVQDSIGQDRTGQDCVRTNDGTATGGKAIDCCGSAGETLDAN